MLIQPRTFVTLTNRIGIFAIFALIYWVFAFILMTVFELRIFRQNLTEIFFLSVAGILAVMAGSLILNVMFNLTRIANSSESLTQSFNLNSLHNTTNNIETSAIEGIIINNDTTIASHTKKHNTGIILIGLLLLFPLTASGLFLGDHLNTKKKYKVMMNDTKQLLSLPNSKTLTTALHDAVSQPDDTISSSELSQTLDAMQLLEKQANQKIEIILPYHSNTDATENNNYLVFNTDNLYRYTNDAVALKEEEIIRDGRIEVITIKTEDVIDTDIDKGEFAKSFDKRKTEYLKQVFAGQSREPYFESHNGNFEMLYPVFDNDQLIGIYYFSDYMRYGKYGS